MILPDTCPVEVYCPDASVQTLGNGDILTVPELLPEWELVVEDLWPVIFEDEE